MSFDLILRDVRLPENEAECVDIGLSGGRIAAVMPALKGDGPSLAFGGRLALPGFIETHLHLDKACILDRCACAKGTLEEAIAEVAAAKRGFTEADIEVRAAKVLERAIAQGTTRIRSHVEVDPRIGLKGFDAVMRLRKAYAWALDIEICVFPQEGLLNDPGTEALLRQALKQGAHLIGGCPYTDTDPFGQIERIFSIAREFDVDIDFHLDFDLDASRNTIEEVCRQTEAHGWGGRVAIGHVTKLSAMPAAQFDHIARLLADAGVAVTVLPATDLFLMGRGFDHNVPRGVAPAHRLLRQGVNCSLSTNNMLNPFTPFGDASLVRMANLFANAAQLGRPQDMADCFDMVTRRSAKLLNLSSYGIAAGAEADIVVLDAQSRAQAVAELAQPLIGFKRGRQSFTRPAPALNKP